MGGFIIIFVISIKVKLSGDNILLIGINMKTRSHQSTYLKLVRVVNIGSET